MLFGIFLLFVVFYAGGRELLLLNEESIDVEWTATHWIFSSFGLVFVTLSIWLNKITTLFDLARGFISKFTGTKKGGGNA